MIRVNYHMTPSQVEWLRTTAKSSGLSVADLIRRAVDEMRAKAERDEARKATRGKKP